MATSNNNNVNMLSVNAIQNEINTSSVDSGKVSTPDDPSVSGHSGIANVNDTTVFVDDAEVMIRDGSAISHVKDSIISLNDTQLYSQSIIDFLAKPIILTTGVFSTTDTYSFLNSYSLPKVAFDAAQGTMWKNKLAGYFGIRMDMRVRIVINANRFQQGRYCVGWVPLGGMVTTTSSLKALTFNNQHMATLIQRTTVPHVEIDLATGTSAELLIPFVSSQSYFPLNTLISGSNISSLGYLNVYPYSPLVAPAGSTTATYTLYVSFENVRLIGAASAQSGYSKSMIKNHRQAEISNKNNGPISSVASAVSRGFKEFSSIPLIGSICNDVSWVAERMAGAASIFGFSKPIQGDSASKISLINASNHSTVDGDSDARPLALLSKPGVTSLEGLSGTQYDEMDFSYIARKYAYFRQENWQLVSAVDATIMTIDVRPGTFSELAGGFLQFTPVAFLATFFTMWRGSIKLKFKFVKTEFHSGRLSFAFYPQDENYYAGNAAYVNRVIVDIRESSEVELIIPYIARTPWLNTQGGNTTTGKVVVSVVDPLIAPATVSNYVTVLAEASGGDDFELSVPGGFEFTPTVMSPQSGFGSNDSKILRATIGNSVVSTDPLISTSLCIGEKITSFRPFLRRFNPISQSSVGNLPSTIFNLNKSEVTIIPDAIIASNGAMVVQNFRADSYSIIGSCYCLSRGGVRIRDVIDFGLYSQSVSSASGYEVVDAVSITNTSAALLTGPPGEQDCIVYEIPTSNYVSTEQGTMKPVVMQNMRYNNSLTVEIPQYTMGYARCVADIIIYSGETMTQRDKYLGGDTSSSTKAVVRINTPNLRTPAGLTGYSLHNLYRAAADDASFSVFISVPPMAFNPENTMKSGFH